MDINTKLLKQIDDSCASTAASVGDEGNLDQHLKQILSALERFETLLEEMAKNKDK